LSCFFFSSKLKMYDRSVLLVQQNAVCVSVARTGTPHALRNRDPPHHVTTNPTWTNMQNQNKTKRRMTTIQKKVIAIMHAPHVFFSTRMLGLCGGMRGHPPEKKSGRDIE